MNEDQIDIDTENIFRVLRRFRRKYRRKYVLMILLQFIQSYL